MGNSCSRNELAELRQRLSRLEGIDQNRDGIISKEEYQEWTQRQKADLEKFKQEIISTKEREYQQQLESLQAEIQTLKSINQDLETRLLQREIKIVPGDASEVPVIAEVNKVLGELSRSYIDQEIDKILANKDVNVRFIPDYYEKKMYRNIFQILFGLLETASHTTSLKFLHHVLTFNIQADTDEIQQDADDNKTEVNTAST